MPRRFSLFQKILATLLSYFLLLTVSGQLLLRRINKNEKTYRDGTRLMEWGPWAPLIMEIPDSMGTITRMTITSTTSTSCYIVTASTPTFRATWTSAAYRTAPHPRTKSITRLSDRGPGTES